MQFFDNCLKIIQTLLPQRCLLCDEGSGNKPLCNACLHDLPALSKASCPVCALPTFNAEICGSCLQHPPAFDATIAAFNFVFPMDALLRALKYRGELSVAEIAANGLMSSLEHHDLPDLLIPMPLHPQRLQERGFNQAMEISRRIVRHTSCQLSTNSVIRLRHGEPQASLPLNKRAKNVKGVFAVNDTANINLRGKRIAVVDDIMTSGASLNELAKTLKKAGATRVECWVVARTLPHV
ncbi:MAG TPA: ComF family protein [Methylophilaceae bacterium]|jgi:ComF family protein